MHINKFLKISFLISIPCTWLTACNSGSTTISQPQTIQIATAGYMPGNKIGMQVSVGGGQTVIGEIDTGSDLTVINASAVGPNIVLTNEVITITYGGGTNTITGNIAYGSLSFTTMSGQTISTSPNMPLVVVESGVVNADGGPNQVILGVEMDNQTSFRLYLPSPYNQMMLINEPNNTLTLGILNNNQLQQFSNIQLGVMNPCNNHGAIVGVSNTCWGTESIPVAYNYTQNGLPNGTTTYNSLFDSGAGNSSFALSTQPSWMNVTGDIVTNTITASVMTSTGILPIQLPSEIKYETSNENKVNTGNNLFNYYQVLFIQQTGIIGLASSSNQI